MNEQMLEAFERFYRSPEAAPTQWTGREADRRRAMLDAFRFGWEMGGRKDPRR